MFSQIKIELGDSYSIEAIQDQNDIAVTVYYSQIVVGGARLTTDNIDVNCITDITLDSEHIHRKLYQQYTLGEILLKFLIKFPTFVRKPEFRIILNAPENFEPILSKFHFDQENTTSLEQEIMLRKQIITPEPPQLPEGIEFKRSIEANIIPDLLEFLKKNAYWQSHITIERLNLLLRNSTYFFAITKHGQIIGFSRVVTNYGSFASLWDVVVDENYRGKGIGTALVLQIFTDPSLKHIPNWILFTDSAKNLYEKFGFISKNDCSEKMYVHKLRIQESHPGYMNELIQIVENGLPFHLDKHQTFHFLFENAGKRANLPSFWKELSDPQGEMGSSNDKIKPNFSN